MPKKKTVYGGYEQQQQIKRPITINLEYRLSLYGFRKTNVSLTHTHACTRVRDAQENGKRCSFVEALTKRMK